MASLPAPHRRGLLAIGAVLVAAALLVTQRDRIAPATPALDPSAPTDAIPSDALLVITADLGRLRESGLGERLRAESRDVPGLGDIREACGFDPIESFDAAAFAVPSGGSDGDFGFAVVGEKVTGEQLLACTTKVIQARGGKPLASKIGSFETVRDVATGATAGEIAARPRGPFLMGAGSYLRSMVDAADGRVTSVHGDTAHARLAGALAGSPLATATLVLGARQRATIADEIARAEVGAPPAIARIAGAAVGLEVQGERVGVHLILACDDARGALDVANALEDLRAQRIDSPLARLSGMASILAAVHVEVERDLVHARLVVPRADAEAMIGLLLSARGSPRPALSALAQPEGAAPVVSAEPSPSVTPSASFPAAPPASASAAREPRRKNKPAQQSLDNRF